MKVKEWKGKDWKEEEQINGKRKGYGRKREE